jgi:hypothetical protein
VVCLNEDQATKDRHDREAIVAPLETALQAGDKQLIGNRGYRKYVKTTGRRLTIDQDKIKPEAPFDGEWVRTTNTDLYLSARELGKRMIESVFATYRLLATSAMPKGESIPVRNTVRMSATLSPSVSRSSV